MRSTENHLGALFGTLASALHAGVVLLDGEGTPLFANDAARGLLELPPGAALGDEGRAALADALAPVLALRRRHEHASGLDEVSLGRQRMLVRRIPLATEGEGELVLLEDRGAGAALAAALVQASRFQVRASLRSQVHDLKAPLNSLALHLELLRRGIEQDEDEERRKEQLETAEVLQREIARLARSLDGFHRNAAGDAAQEPRRLDVRDVVRGVARLVRQSAKAADVRVVLRLPDGPVRCRLVGEHLEQALLALVLNALESQEQGGEVRLVVARTDDGTSIAVEDDGPGIPAPLANRVFETGFTTRPGANGIGLSVARSLVDALRGRLSLEGRPDRGTTASILLPDRDDEAPT